MTQGSLSKLAVTTLKDSMTEWITNSLMVFVKLFYGLIKMNQFKESFVHELYITAHTENIVQSAWNNGTHSNEMIPDETVYIYAHKVISTN